MSFPRYPKYKDSGVEWLGEVPEHWGVAPLKRVASLRSGDSITSEAIEESGDYPVFGAGGIRGYTARYTHEGAFPIVGRQGALCGNVQFGEGRFWASEHAVVATPGEQYDPIWLREVLRAMNLNQYSISAAQPGLAVDQIGRLCIPIPAAHEQHAIASFLDRETAKIDALVAEQQRLMELLKEKRQAVISHAVTKGLNPDAPMKPSGVEWLGEVPAHWEVKRLKHVSESIVDCPHETPEYSDGGDYYVVRTADVNRGVLNAILMRRVDNAEYARRIRRAPLRESDIVYAREGERWGHAALVDRHDHYCLGQRMIQVVPAESASAAFLMWSLNSDSTYRQGESDTVGATSPHINLERIGNFYITWPPVDERVAIGAFLLRSTRNFDYLISEAKGAQKLLTERRSALISAAVTGQIDVRHLATAEAA